MKRYLGTASRALLAVITLLAGPALALEQAALVTLETAKRRRGYYVEPQQLTLFPRKS